MPIAHSLSTRGLLPSRSSPTKAEVSSQHDSNTKEISSVTGFLLDLVDKATKNKDNLATAASKVVEARQWRGLVMPRTNVKIRHPSTSTIMTSPFDMDNDIGKDAPAIIDLLISKRYSVEAQLTGIGQLLRRLRNDDAQTYQNFSDQGGLTLLLLAMREFRYHAPLQVEIAHCLSLFCKYSEEYVAILHKEYPLPLIAKTMAIHPTDEQIQLHLSVVQDSLRNFTEDDVPNIAYYDNRRPMYPGPSTLPRDPTPGINPQQRAPIWLPPDSVCSKHHEAFDLENGSTFALNSKCTRLAGQSRIPTTSNSPLRRVLSTPKMPHLSADFAFDRAQSPVEVELPRVMTVPLPPKLSLDNFPHTASRGMRPHHEPVIATKFHPPSLSAYKATPLFVEPAALATRLGVPFTPDKPTIRPVSKKRRNTSVPSLSSSISIPALPPKPQPEKPKYRPNSLQEHHAAMTIQRYFRRNLCSPATRDSVQSTTTTENRDELDEAMATRDENMAKLRAIQAHFCKGLDHQQAGNWEVAEECYVQSLELHCHVEFASVHVNLGSAHLSQGQYAKAQELFVRALEIAPNNVAALYNLSLSLWHQGCLEDTVSSLAKVLTLEPSHSKAIYALHVLKTQIASNISSI
ncbi:hypothetical protein THRCLA_05560 [Thraustotheca clavata]|uniref:Uncharacterized protein n=1 Tax=Thraustotheca clavata TaxID=74557 RepID=A0A1V9ZW69_9STRA|nr:hypothetical protein THRCLA_05560 [Thraustotheca clavata]